VSPFPLTTPSTITSIKVSLTLMSENPEVDTQKGIEFDVDSKEEKMEGSDHDDNEIEEDISFSLGLSDEEEDIQEETKGVNLDDKKGEIKNNNKIEEQQKEEPKVEVIPVIPEIPLANPVPSIQSEKIGVILPEPSIIGEITIPKAEFKYSEDISVTGDEYDADTVSKDKIIETKVITEKRRQIIEEPVIVIEEIPEPQEEIQQIEEIIIFDEGVEIPTTDDQSDDTHLKLYQVKIVTVLSNNNLNEVVIELTLLYDLFFMMYVSINSEQYASLQEEYDLSITFKEFPENLVTLFSSKPQDSSISIEFDNDSIIHFNERLNLRSLELFQLQFSEPNPDYKNKSIQMRFSQMKQTRNILQEQYLSFIDEMNKKNPLMMERMIPYMTSDVQRQIKATTPSAKKSTKSIRF